jgi:hypothetical protein
MRTISAVILLLTACSSQKTTREAAGWSYTSEGYRNQVEYDFGGPEQISFFGTCDRQPIYLLKGGMPEGAIDVRIDGKSWPFVAIQTEHSRGFTIDQPSVVEAIGQAKRVISFERSGWKRELRPTALLQRFIDECVARRKIDPAARKWFNSANLVEQTSGR